MKKLLVLVLAVLLIVFSAVGASAKDSPKAKVRVSITADEGTKNIISKFVERELQGLPDVEIVENDADYTFVILAVEIFNKSGVKTGISLSLLFLEKFHNKFLDTMIDKKSKFKGFIIYIFLLKIHKLYLIEFYLDHYHL